MSREKFFFLHFSFAEDCAAAQMYFKHANDAADLIADFHNFLTPRHTDCRLSIYPEFIRPPMIIS